jgi:hypothetical protein
MRFRFWCSPRRGQGRRPQFEAGSRRPPQSRPPIPAFPRVSPRSCSRHDKATGIRWRCSFPSRWRSSSGRLAQRRQADIAGNARAGAVACTPPFRCPRCTCRRPDLSLDREACDGCGPTRLVDDTRGYTRRHVAARSSGAARQPASAYARKIAGLFSTRAGARHVTCCTSRIIQPAACHGYGTTRLSSAPRPGPSCAPPRSIRSASSPARE